MPDTSSMQISIFNVVAVIFSATFAIYSAKIVATIANLVKSIGKPKESPKVTQLKEKIAEARRELNGISPTGEFAKYFKKERELNKMTEELTVLEGKQSSETARNLKIDTVTRVVLQFSSLALLRYVSGITAYCIPDTIFWPFNFIMRFPALWGNDSCPAEFAEVSGFALAFLMLHLVNLIWKTVKNRKNPLKSEKKTETPKPVDNLPLD